MFVHVTFSDLSEPLISYLSSPNELGEFLDSVGKKYSLHRTDVGEMQNLYVINYFATPKGQNLSS